MKKEVYYRYVSIKNKWIEEAYNEAKKLYNHKKWNLKTTPVAVIVKNDKFISLGISANGKHPLLGKCDRLGKSGTDYDKCEHCAHDQHAERFALNKVPHEDLKGAEIYLYGHYKMCDECIKELQKRGIYHYYLLENSEVLFDRHNKDTVLGTNKQFVI